MTAWGSGGARGDGDGGRFLGQGRAGGRGLVSPGCCTQRGEALMLVYLHHAHPSRFFLPMEHSARPGVSKMQQHRQEGSGGSWSRDKHCFAQRRPACTAPPSTPRRPTAYRTHENVLLAPKSQRCRGRERGGAAGGRKRGRRASLLLGAAWQAGRHLPLVFFQLGHPCGTTGSSAG